MPKSQTKPQPTDRDDVFDLQLAADTLRGDVRDSFLSHLKNMRKPWPQMTQLEQSEAIGRANDLAYELVRRAVYLIAAEGRKVIVGQLVKATMKDVIKAEISLPKFDPERHTLLDSVGEEVLIVVANVDAFSGEQAPAKPEDDQRAMRFRADIEN